MYTHNGIDYPDQMPAQVIILDGPHCKTHGWIAGGTCPVLPTYREEQYQLGGYYVQVDSALWKHGIPLGPGSYKPA